MNNAEDLTRTWTTDGSMDDLKSILLIGGKEERIENRYSRMACQQVFGVSDNVLWRELTDDSGKDVRRT